jgi:hypothetical protein
VAAMHIEASARRITVVLGAVVALIGVSSAIGAAVGGKYIGPGAQIDSLAKTDALVFRDISALRDTIHIHDREQVAFRDTMMASMRPLSIFLCLNATPKDTALMDLDCDRIVGQARNGAIMRANDRAFEAPWRNK